MASILEVQRFDVVNVAQDHPGEESRLTVNSGYFEYDDTPSDDNSFARKFSRFMRNHAEEPLEDPPTLFDNDGVGQQRTTPTTNESGRETPLVDVEMDWSE